jgi:galactose-1-phosphate uridylyltransferase
MSRDSIESDKIHDGDSAIDNIGSSIFDQRPFQEFTSKKFRELLNKENMDNLIKMREQILEIRLKTEMDLMNKMLENKRVSPRTFKTKSLEFEKWVSKEKEDLKKTKREIERGWLKTADTIQRVI